MRNIQVRVRNIHFTEFTITISNAKNKTKELDQKRKHFYKQQRWTINARRNRERRKKRLDQFEDDQEITIRSKKTGQRRIEERQG